MVVLGCLQGFAAVFTVVVRFVLGVLFVAHLTLVCGYLLVLIMFYRVSLSRVYFCIRAATLKHP